MGKLTNIELVMNNFTSKKKRKNTKPDGFLSNFIKHLRKKWCWLSSISNKVQQMRKHF